MNDKEKLDCIESYLEKYLDEMLIEDIKKMVKKSKEDKDFRFTIPYILLISAGIDFLGGLEKGFFEINEQGIPCINKHGKKINSSSRKRSKHFIKEWMTKVEKIGELKNLYGEEGMGDVIYSLARCGASHQSIYKKGVECYKGDDLREKHLFIRSKNENNQERIFIHALQFADDFIESQKIFREEYIKKNSESVYKNLAEILLEEKIEKLNLLIENLKNKKHFIEDEVSPSPSAALEIDCFN